MKKLLGGVMALLLTVSVNTGSLSAAPIQNFKTHSSHVNQKCLKEKHQGLENLIRSSLQKNNGDLNKVKKDVNQYLAKKRALRGEKLARIAKKKGISVEELKTRISEKRQERLERRAKEIGVTTEELKNQMINRHQQKMESMAKNLGITTEHLKQILPDHPANKS